MYYNSKNKFSSKKINFMSIAIIVPAYKESDNIEKLIFSILIIGILYFYNKLYDI